jgi:hypothetical protein
MKAVAENTDGKKDFQGFLGLRNEYLLHRGGTQGGDSL